MGSYGTIIYLVAIFAVFYLFIIRPQSTRQRQQQELVSSLQPGDEVVTAGGIYGTVREVRDDRFALEVAPGVVIEVAKQAVMAKAKPLETAPSAEVLPEPEEPPADEKSEE